MEMELTKFAILFLSLSTINCLQKFIRNHFEDDTIVIIAKTNANLQFLFKLNHTKIIINPQLPFSEKSVENRQNYIIIEDNPEDLNSTVDQFASNFNTRANFLLIFQNNCTEDDLKIALETLWNFYIYNVVIYTNSGDFVTWYPYHEENKCGEIVNLVINPKLPNLYQNKIPGRLNGYCVKVTWATVLTVIRTPFNQSNPGHSIEFLNAIAHNLNLKLNYLRDNTDYIDLLAKKHNFEDLVSNMIRRKIDVAIVPLRETQRITKSMETTTVIHYIHSYFVLPPPKRIMDGFKLFRIFSKLTWSLILASIVAMTMLWKKMEKSSFFHIIRLFLQFNIMKIPRRISHRLICLLFLIYVMNLNWMYLTQLSSILTQPNYEPKIRTLQDLSKSKILLKIHKIYEPAILEKNEIYGELKKKMSTEFENAAIEVLNDFINKFNYGTILSETSILSFKQPHGLQILTRDYVVKTSWTLMVRRGFPFLDKFNIAILIIHESGMLHKWIDNSLAKSKKISISDGNEEEIVPLGFEHVYSVFIVWGVGILGSFLVFIVELIKTSKTSKLTIL